jgi:hypothetical protein
MNLALPQRLNIGTLGRTNYADVSYHTVAEKRCRPRTEWFVRPLLR